MSNPKQQEYLHELGDDQNIIDRTLEWFRLFASVPHGSWNEKALSDLLKKKFEDLGWATEQDQWSNLKVDVPGVPGLDHLPPVIIQGHLDMVCAVAQGSGYVPERDPITVVVENGILRSDGRSSLGADCGLGLSIAFSVVEKTLQRGPVRLLLTVAEESGLEGAQLVDPAWLKGCKWMINVDAGSTKSVIVSCAGAWRERFTKPIETVSASAAHAYEVVLNGLKGGHSGGSIHLGRGNANKLLNHFLCTLREKTDYELTGLYGGYVGNAIPIEARATVVVNDKNILFETAEFFQTRLNEYYKNIDPDVKIELRETPCPEQVWSREMRDSTLDLIALLHNGVAAMHDTIPGQVSTSANLGVCRANEQGDYEVKLSVRSHEPFQVEVLEARHSSAARLTGYQASFNSSYPGCSGSLDNPLALLIDRVCQRQGGDPMTVKALHVGLELGVLGSKNPDLTAVSVAPDALDAHTVTERAPIARFPVFARLLAGTLEELASAE